MFTEEEDFSIVWEFFRNGWRYFFLVAWVFQRNLKQAQLDGRFCLLLWSLVVLDESAVIQALETYGSSQSKGRGTGEEV